jgi:hypothetical protein
MKTTCPKCQAPIEITSDDAIYDAQDYLGKCHACEAFLKCVASVVVTYAVDIAELDEEGQPIWFDYSVDVRAPKEEA